MRKTYLLETAVAAVAGLMFTSVAFAEPSAEVFRAAGCEVEFLRPVLAGDGTTVLYWQNTDGRGCEPSRKGGLRDDLANMPPVEEEEEVPADEEVATVW